MTSKKYFPFFIFCTSIFTVNLNSIHSRVSTYHKSFTVIAGPCEMKTFLVFLRTEELDLLVKILGFSVPGGGVCLAVGWSLSGGGLPPPPCEQANRCKNITFPCGR